MRQGLFGDARGSAVIEKVIIIGVLLFGVWRGVLAVSSGSTAALDRHAQCVGSNRFDCGSSATPSAGSGSLAETEAPPPSTRPKPVCDGITCMCFVAGTLVVTREGPRAIETIEPGTFVLSRPEEGQGPAAFKPVLERFLSTSGSIVRLTTINVAGREETFETTGAHPFFVEDRGWIEARELVPGRDLLVDLEGRPVRLVMAESRDEQVPVYNLEVADHHTYHVGLTGLWVHNQDRRATKIRLILSRPGNPVGREVQLRLRRPGQSATFRLNTRVQRRNADGTFDVSWRDGDRTRTATIDRNGNLVVLHPVVGEHVQLPRPPDAQGPGGGRFDAYVIRTNDRHGSEFEGLLDGRRVSGTINSDGSYTLHGPPNKATWQPGQAIGGLMPVDHAGPYQTVDYTQLGNIRIWHPTANEEDLQGAENFVRNTLTDLNTIAQTPSGIRLLNSIHGPAGPSAGPVDIRYGENQDTNEARTHRPHDAGWGLRRDAPGRGDSVEVVYRAGLDTPYQMTERDLPMLQADFGRAMNAPSDVTLFHELVHADDFRKGLFVDDRVTRFGGTLSVTEERAVGLGDFAPSRSSAYTENSYRSDRGLPSRPFYNAASERYSSAATRGFSADWFLNSQQGAGGSGGPGNPDELAVARLHLLAATKHDGRTGMLRDFRENRREAHPGHSWIALEYLHPTRDLPEDWQTRFPDHYWPLKNPGRVPLGHHMGFNNHGRPISASESVPGAVEIMGRRAITELGPTAVQSYDLRQSDVENLLQFVEQSRGRDYNLLTHNCTTWAVQAVQAAGQRPPDSRIVTVANPASLWEGIRANERRGVDGARTTTLVERPGEGAPPGRRPADNLLDVPAVSHYFTADAPPLPAGSVALPPLTPEELALRAPIPAGTADDASSIDEAPRPSRLRTIRDRIGQARLPRPTFQMPWRRGPQVQATRQATRRVDIDDDDDFPPRDPVAVHTVAVDETGDTGWAAPVRCE
ncbi:MAG TPA: polymorphic toxin-type HINT domain-containing protein [Polyangia bacterium]